MVILELIHAKNLDSARGRDVLIRTKANACPSLGAARLPKGDTQ